MNIKQLSQQFTQSSPLVKLALVSLAIIWALVIVVLVVGAVLVLERPSQALQPTPGSGAPAISLTPASGSAGSSVTVSGENWPAGSTVLVYLSEAGQLDYALASAQVDEAGRFAADFIVPTTGRWVTAASALVIVRSSVGEVTVQALLSLTPGVEQPTQTPVATDTAEPSPTATSSPTPLPTNTAQPGLPLATASTDLNVRQGPGVNYPILGLLRSGQTAEITGRNADGQWWQIRFTGVAGERGWLAARYVDARNAANVPVVQAPPAPAPTAIPTATPTPRPTDVVIRDWRGEYYDNRHLSGAPVLVRNDVAINFNWGNGSPAAGLPADNFSVRWTRSLNLPAGLYRIAVRVDDGVRVWVDGRLVIDQWRDSSPTTYTADVRLDSGWHDFRIEYYERSGGALIELGWQRLNDANQPPQAVPGGPYSLREGSAITLDGSRSKDPDGQVTRYEWDFNYDGRTFTVDATGKNPTVSYPDGPASYVIGLRVIDDRGAVSQVATTWANVENVAPVAKAGGPYSGLVGQAIRLTGTATDPSPVDQASLFYWWDFGDGATANGAVVDHVYTQPGAYTARLTVSDRDNALSVATATVQVQVANQAPRAVIEGPAQGQVNQSLSFNGSGSTDPDGSIAGYTWNFGDGTIKTGPSASHSYGLPGLYLVTLTVVDNAGLTGSAEHTVRIDPVAKTPPVARINAPAGGFVGDSLNFSGSGSTDADGTITGYSWDFGDGTTAAGTNVSHVYNATGTYQVTLTVTDNDGLTGRATHNVVVDQVIQIELPPMARFSGPDSGRANEPLVFDASASSDQDGVIVAYTWDFGDGTVKSGPSATTSQTYAQPGLYTISLTVTDDDGMIDSTSQTVTIQ